jgi:hypothetical protein
MKTFALIRSRLVVLVSCLAVGSVSAQRAPVVAENGMVVSVH